MVLAKLSPQAAAGSGVGIGGSTDAPSFNPSFRLAVPDYSLGTLAQCCGVVISVVVATMYWHDYVRVRMSVRTLAKKRSAHMHVCNHNKDSKTQRMNMVNSYYVHASGSRTKVGKVWGSEFGGF